MTKIPHEHKPWFALGILEAGGRIYSSAVIVVTRNEDVKYDLKQTYGGSIEPGRWVLKGKKERIRLLEGWAQRTHYSDSAIAALAEANRLRRLLTERRVNPDQQSPLDNGPQESRLGEGRPPLDPADRGGLFDV